MAKGKSLLQGVCTCLCFHIGTVISMPVYVNPFWDERDDALFVSSELQCLRVGRYTSV